MDVTVTSAADLITCAGCGAHVPFTESLYVDGAGQLCTAHCTSPLPEWMAGIEPPFRIESGYALLSIKVRPGLHYRSYV